MARTLLTDDIWQQIQDTMRLHGCYCSKNSRNIMEAILWKLRTGATFLKNFALGKLLTIALIAGQVRDYGINFF